MRLLVSTLVLTLAWFSALNIAFVIAGMADCRWTPAWSVLCPAVGSVALRPPGGAVPGIVCLRDWRVPPVHLMFEGRERSEYFGALLWSGALLGVRPDWRECPARRSRLRGYARLRRTWGRPVGRDPDRQRLRNPGHLARRYSFTRRSWSAACPRGAYARRAGRALAHEVAHWQSWDNVKRFAMFASPDVLRFTRAANDLEHGWRAEAECLADARAVDGMPRCGQPCICAVKVARLATARTEAFLAGPSWSAFHEEGCSNSVFAASWTPHRRAPVLLAVAGWIDGGGVGNDRSGTSQTSPRGAFLTESLEIQCGLEPEFTRGGLKTPRYGTSKAYCGSHVLLELNDTTIGSRESSRERSAATRAVARPTGN